MKYLSLFTGVGGFEIGIDRAFGCLQPELDRPTDLHDTTDKLEQWKCVGFSEIDKYANQVLKYRFPNITNYGDCTKIDPATLPDFDLLVGGFPCQAFSVAGKRKGFDDTRGTLFFDIARILAHKRPRHLVLENVKGLLSHDNGKTFQTILKVLTDLGYSVEWQVLNAKDFGVPQNRERIFIVGHLGGEPARKVFPIGPDGPETDGLSGHVSNTLTRRYEGAQAVGTYIGEGQLNAQEIQQLNQPRHSNDRVYGEQGIAPTLNTAQGGNRQPFVKIKEATKAGYAVAEEGDSINLSVPNSKTRRGRVGVGVAQTLDTAANQATLQDMRIRRLTPTECERLMSWEDGWTKYGINDKGETVEMSDTQRYKMCGNGVVSEVVKAVIEKLI